MGSECGGHLVDRVRSIAELARTVHGDGGEIVVAGSDRFDDDGDAAERSEDRSR
jgi:hypothetical protein